MAFTTKYVQTQPYTLAGAGVAIGATSLTLVSMEDIDGTLLAMTDFGTLGFATIEPNNGVYEEQISFSGITQNANGTATLTGIKTVLFKDPYTQTDGFAKSHIGGAKLVISNTSGFYNTIKEYIDGIAVAGSPDASTTAKGIAEEATAAEINAGTQAGGTSAELFVNPKYLKDSTYYTQLPSSDEKAALAGTGTPSVSNKFVTADTDALKEVLANKDTDGTLAANSDTKYPSQKAVKTYADSNPGTHKCGIATRDLSAASGSQTIAHGLGRAPKVVRMTATTAKSTGGFLSSSTGFYDGTNKACVWGGLTYTNVTTSGSSSSYIIYLETNGTALSYATVTVDATNITLAWTRNSSESITANIAWEVE